MITYITTTESDMRVASEDELVLLDQVIDIDGRDAVVLDSAPVKNGSGRVVGEHLIIDDEAWRFVVESLQQGAPGEWRAEDAAIEAMLDDMR